jgi:hypothetical protein
MLKIKENIFCYYQKDEKDCKHLQDTNLCLCSIPSYCQHGFYEEKSTNAF